MVPESRSLRQHFCSYARENLGNYRVLLAEAVSNELRKYSEPDLPNIALLERVIAEISTCVVLFPESEGSIAELGYFAGDDELREIMLVANDAKFHDDPSFISLGLVQLVDGDSIFPPLSFDYSNTENLVAIKERIEDVITPRKYRRKLPPPVYSQLDHKIKLFVVFEIVRIFRVLTLDELEFAVKKIMRSAQRDELQWYLSILAASSYVECTDSNPGYFFARSDADSFLDLPSFDGVSFRLELMDVYETLFPDLAKILKEKRQ